jgi:hypothetical protein
MYYPQEQRNPTHVLAGTAVAAELKPQRPRNSGKKNLMCHLLQQQPQKVEISPPIAEEGVAKHLLYYYDSSGGAKGWAGEKQQKGWSRDEGLPAA